MKKFLLILLSFSFFSIFPQSTHKIMSYNALNYPGSDASVRNPYFSTVISNAAPDILVMQEMTSLSGVNDFLNNVLIPINSDYTLGAFNDGPDTDNSIFYKNSLFTFISNTVIPTSLRDINEFKLVHKISGDTLRIFSVHLKASTGTTNEQQRLAEVTTLRNYTAALPPNSNFLVCGDFNFYGSTEPAYQKLLDQSTQGYFIDIYNLAGTWNNVIYAQYHTQSTRVRQFGGGATGGLDDRFDLLLFSPSLLQESGIDYVSNTYTAYGNDGLHYNDSINSVPNTAVSQEIANALHYSSDHLPVFASFTFEIQLPVELTAFYATASSNSVNLTWQTATEINNYGFNIERSANTNEDKNTDWLQIGFIQGNGNSNSPHSYHYQDNNLSAGDYAYRLKQIDNDGQYKYSDNVTVKILPGTFTLYQNYPNPFNPSTTISYNLPTNDFVILKIYDVLGNEITTLINEEQQAGFHKINFNANNYSSGMYFYKLSSGKITLTSKMILIK